MDIVIFGGGNFSSQAWYVLTHDSPHRVAGFTVDGDYCTGERFHDLPMVPFEELERHFPPDRFVMLVSLGGRNINGLRAVGTKRQRLEVIALYPMLRLEPWFGPICR